MNKTVKVSGLQLLLNRLQPLVKSIAGGTVQLADGVVLNLPDECTLSFAEGGDPESIRVSFNGITADIHETALYGLLHVGGREPVTYADVGPSSIQTRVSVFTVTAVDDGGS
jgi:hypothetical protein